MFAFGLALLFVFGFAQHSDQDARGKAEQFRQQSIELNTLAGEIRSEGDARKLMDKVAEMFAEQLPPPWATTAVRERLARAEYAAVTDPSQLIPEERIAGVWNQYVRALGAPAETLVTAAEIHWLRDAYYSGGQLAWSRGGYTSVWNMPNMFAIGADGKVANGCRALETLRVLWDLDNMFPNVRRAREMMQKGVLMSDRVKQQLENPGAPKTRFEVRSGLYVNPVRTVEQSYIQEHGLPNYYLLLDKLFNELFPE